MRSIIVRSRGRLWAPGRGRPRSSSRPMSPLSNQSPARSALSREVAGLVVVTAAQPEQIPVDDRERRLVEGVEVEPRHRIAVPFDPVSITHLSNAAHQTHSSRTCVRVALIDAAAQPGSRSSDHPGGTRCRRPVQQITVAGRGLRCRWRRLEERPSLGGRSARTPSAHQRSPEWRTIASALIVPPPRPQYAEPMTPNSPARLQPQAGRARSPTPEVLDSGPAGSRRMSGSTRAHVERPLASGTDSK